MIPPTPRDAAGDVPLDDWAMLLHELRTPTAIALGRTQLLQRRLRTDGAVDRERVMADLRTIEVALARLAARLAASGAFVPVGMRRNVLPGPLAAARRRAGMSHRTLAAAAGVSPATVAGLERGTGRLPKTATIQRLAAVLGVPPEDLMSWEPDPDWDLGQRGAE